jgi:predicted MFS family arabinose efflux permease
MPPISEANPFVRLPKLAPDGMAARVFLAFLATAGMYYVNIMPAVISGLIEGLGFSNREAGFVGSANVYGAAAGALLAVFVVGRIRWRPTAAVLLTGLMFADAASMLTETPPWMIGIRFIDGLLGGMLVGVAFAVIARTREADRTFGVLLAVQFGLGGLGVMLLPPLVPQFGTQALFAALLAFSAVTLAMLPFASAYAAPVPVAPGTRRAPIAVRPVALTLLAVFLFQAANMALFAYIIGLGRHYGLDDTFINPTLGAAGWVGIVGALLVVTLGLRFGRTIPLLVAMTLTIAGTWALLFSDSRAIFFIANCGTGITWAFVVPYLFGMCAEYDRAGRWAAVGGFASKLGLASGPLGGALLLGDGNYEQLVLAAMALLTLSTAAALSPTIALDRAERAARVPATPLLR